MEILKAKAWQTDEHFGYDYWRAAEYSCGLAKRSAVIVLFENDEERDRWLKGLDEILK